MCHSLLDEDLLQVFFIVLDITSSFSSDARERPLEIETNLYRWQTEKGMWERDKKSRVELEAAGAGTTQTEEESVREAETVREMMGK